jgi:CheY-like chemotaxis protein
MAMAEQTEQRRVLVVEDDPLVRDVLVLMLEEEAAEVTASHCAVHALGLLTDPAGPGFDVVVCDCLLPDGRPDRLLEAADRLRVPVVMTSGDLKQAAMVAPGRIFLAKPFTKTALTEAIEAVLR